MDTKPWTGFRARIYSVIWRSPKTNSLVVRLAGLSASDRVLDIGCGPGAAVRKAAAIVVDGEAAGVDRSEPMVDIARRRSRRFPNARFEVGSAESLPFADGSFTVVWTAHSFHHWEDRDAGLAEMLRVLSDGGRGLILETDGKKHGLTDSASAAVVADMERLGFRDVAVEKVDKQVIISGVCGSPNLST
ncbi:MAG: class I SAM-dependent methyltransferase [Acidimicrobiia bacterium]|nr:class I SAM-dependent methyltransferase [Acidimicrobiia bacterium]